MMKAAVTKERAEELNRLQLDFHTRGIPVMIVFEGGNGIVINRIVNEIHNCLEPRGVAYHGFDPRTKGPSRPFGFLQGTPVAGGFALHDRSWYSSVVDRYRGGRESLESFVGHCNTFERYLTDNGVFLIKILLDADPGDADGLSVEYCPFICMRDTFLSVDIVDPVKFRAMVSDGLFSATDTDCAPWDTVTAGELRRTVDGVAAVIADRLRDRSEGGCPVRPVRMETPYPDPRPSAGSTPPPAAEPEDVYDLLYELQTRLAASDRSLVVGFEGRDAAGKGSAIRHLTRALNPRGYKVVEIKAPTAEERSYTYLRRFAEHMPDAGRITVFDRTWYGRMTVEPIEGLCSEDEYERSASEINAMEKCMTDNGILLVKIWLDVSAEEQLRRFEKRAADELKQWKLTDDDWRNRGKWDEYEARIGRMMTATNTPYAPWTAVPADDKAHARALVLDAIATALRTGLAGDRPAERI